MWERPGLDHMFPRFVPAPGNAAVVFDLPCVSTGCVGHAALMTEKFPADPFLGGFSSPLGDTLKKQGEEGRWGGRANIPSLVVAQIMFSGRKPH